MQTCGPPFPPPPAHDRVVDVSDFGDLQVNRPRGPTKLPPIILLILKQPRIFEIPQRGPCQQLTCRSCPSDGIISRLKALGPKKEKRKKKKKKEHKMIRRSANFLFKPAALCRLMMSSPTNYTSNFAHRGAWDTGAFETVTDVIRP